MDKHPRKLLTGIIVAATILDKLFVLLGSVGVPEAVFYQKMPTISLKTADKKNPVYPSCVKMLFIQIHFHAQNMGYSVFRVFVRTQDAANTFGTGYILPEPSGLCRQEPRCR